MTGGIIINAILIVCVFWVFFDAANNNIGTFIVSDGIQKGYRKGLHPVSWALLSMFIIPFFMYLIRRKALKELAKENPVITDKSISFIILLILVSAWTLYSYRDYLFS